MAHEVDFPVAAPAPRDAIGIGKHVLLICNRPEILHLVKSVMMVLIHMLFPINLIYDFETFLQC